MHLINYLICQLLTGASHHFRPIPRKMPFGMRTVDLLERLGGTMYCLQMGLMPAFYLKVTRPDKEARC